MEEKTLGFTGTLKLLDEMMETDEKWPVSEVYTKEELSTLDELLTDPEIETEESKSRRRSALKYEYFRTMTPYGNI